MDVVSGASSDYTRRAAVGRGNPDLTVEAQPGLPFRAAGGRDRVIKTKPVSSTGRQHLGEFGKVSAESILIVIIASLHARVPTSVKADLLVSGR